MIHLHLGADLTMNLVSPFFAPYIAGSLLHEYCLPARIVISDLRIWTASLEALAVVTRTFVIGPSSTVTPTARILRCSTPRRMEACGTLAGWLFSIRPRLRGIMPRTRRHLR